MALRDFLFQISLFVASVALSFIAALLSKRGLKIVASILAILLFGIAFVWTGYEMALHDIVQRSNSATPGTIANQSPIIVFPTASPTLVDIPVPSATTSTLQQGKTVVATTNVPLAEPTIASVSAVEPNNICEDAAFAPNTWNTRSPLIRTAESYQYAWVTSDAADIVMPDGSLKRIDRRFLLIIDGLTELQIRDVALGANHANVYACWYRDDRKDDVMKDAETQWTNMHDESPGTKRYMLKLSKDGTLTFVRQD